MSTGSQQPLSPVKQALLALETMTAKVEALERAKNEPIAIIGLSCRFPGAPDAESFWNVLREGRDVVGSVPESRWDAGALYDSDPDAPGRMSTRWGGFLDGIEQFDPEFFGISPREAASMDPQQRLLLEVAWEALENAGQGPDRLAACRTGVFAGITGDEYAQLFYKAGDVSKYDVYFASGIARSVAGGRISYVLGIQGPNMAIDTACSSSLVAVHTACLHLRSGDCRMALAGGANVILSPEITMAFSKARMMAADGRCKAFDARADGFVRAEGCGVIVLKRLSDAVADGDRVLAVIRGTAINQDGRSSGLTAPSGAAQEAVIRDALAKSALRGSEIDYVEAHGTGTSLGDPIEAHALRETLGPNRDASTPLVIGSVKTNMGHLESAAGIAGLIKVVLSLQHDWIPAHLHYESLNPHIDWRGVPVEIPVGGREWRHGSRLRLAGVSAFGFSGTNAHVIVEESPADPEPDASEPVSQDGLQPTRVLALAARTDRALSNLASSYASHLTAQPGLRLADICLTANAGRTPQPERLAIPAASTGELIENLRAVAAGQQFAPGVARARATERARCKVAFLFTGQGAQFAGMGHQLYASEPVFRAAIDECERLLSSELDQPLTSLLWGEASHLLDETQYTQPVLFAVEWALAQLWQSWGVEPSVVLGHSVGEYVAACVAGVYPLADGLRLIAIRGRLMGSLPRGEGAMAAALAPVEAVRSAIGANATAIGIAAVNGVANTVVSGARSAVDEVAAKLEGEGFRVERLRVSHAFHSQLMAPVEAAFEAEAAKVAMAAPKRLLVSSVTGALLSERDLGNPGYWRQQVRDTVRFHAAVETAAAQGCAIWLEIGPGSTLLGLTRDAVESAHLVPSLRRGQDESRLIAGSLAALWVRGVHVDWEAVGRSENPRRVALPTYPFEREPYWVELSHRGAAPAAAVPSPGGTAAHPLLGNPVQTAHGEIVCQTRISVRTLPLLADHVVHGLAVLPATAYLEMMASGAAIALGRGELSIESVTIDHALAIQDSEERVVETLVKPAGDGRASVEIHSQPGRGGAWTRHAAASVRLTVDDAGAHAAPPSIDEVRGRCRTEIDIAAFYANLRGRGLTFGDSFHGLREIWRTDKEALGSIAPPLCVQNAHEFRMHPAVLDACIQTLAAATPGFDPADVNVDIYMPVGIDRVIWRIGTSTLDQLESHCWFDSADRGAGYWVGNVSVRSGHSEIIRIEALRLRKVPKASLFEIAAPAGDCYYEISWDEAPGPRDKEPVLAHDSEVLQQRLVELCRSHGTDEYDRLNPALDRVCTAMILQALRKLGWAPTVGDRVSAESLAKLLGVQPRYGHLLNRLLAILAEDGILTDRNGAWEVTRLPTATAAPDAELVRAKAEGRVDAELTLRCGGRLAEVLSGAADPLQVLFKDGDLGEAVDLYTKTPSSKAYNSLVGEAVASLARGVLAGQPVRVLEIGAGTGGTTTWVLPQLPAGRTEYVFTDLGHSFLARARETFRDCGRQMTYQVLDIERDPAAQGIECGTFDIVIASNVLHATADLAASLDNARKLLRKGGALVLFESTRPQRWFDLTFGLTEGWWRFAGRDGLRNYTLLDVDGWRVALRASGFQEPSAILRRDLENPAYAILIATAEQHPVQQPAREPWLVFVGESGVAGPLARGLGQEGKRCISVQSGTDYAFSSGVITIRPDCPADYRRALRDVEQVEGTPVQGILHLWAMHDPDTPNEDMLTARQAAGCQSVLLLTQAVAARSDAAAIPCWVATRNAQPVGASTSPNISHSTILGFVRAVAVERPDCRLACVDLQEDAGDEEAAGQLLDEALRCRFERQIAYRNRRRHTARLTRRPRYLDGKAAEAGSVELSLPETRSLDGIGLRPQSRRVPGPGEVEVRVHATGLNFRDVLNALGMRRDEDPLGGEASGTVARVGPGVTSAKPGDEVIAISPGTFASYVVAPHTLVFPKPRAMTFADAAAVPFAFLTADYALREIGGLSKGERVLIHAAAGGVGLAAVQIALAAGAEVFATAGSREKREFLAAFGVAHVMDSRSLSFEQEVRERTGGAGIDIVLNSLTGAAIPAGLRLLSGGGRFLEIGKAEVWDQERAIAANPDARYFEVDLTGRIINDHAAIRERLELLLSEFAGGALRPLPRSIFRLEDAAGAFRHMARARHIGKVILTPSDSGGTSPRSEVRFREDAWYLLTGGLRGLGVEVAKWMAGRGARRLILMSRQAPSDEAEAAVSALRAGGVEVRIARGDVSRRTDIDAAISELGVTPLRGVFHLAGVLEDGLLQEQTWDRFETVFAPKVHGSWNLHLATRALPLDFFVLFSSTASVFGAPGQSNHGAANAFLDALAHRRRAEGLHALSINWGPWAEVGAAAGPTVQRRLAGLGLRAFSVAEGLHALGVLLRHDDSPQIAAIAVDWPTYLEQSGSSANPFFTKLVERAPSIRVGIESQPPNAAPVRDELRLQLEAIPKSKRRGALEAHVEACARRILGLRPGQPLDLHWPLSEMGLDSLMAVELRNWIGTSTGLSLPATLLFDYPTVTALGGYLLTAKFGAAAAESDRAAAKPLAVASSSTLDAIELLSDEEVERLLSKEE